ncbi:MAG: intein-containing recombinase RecA [Actinobacteria bacterium]|nr:intein-containing recombinase RecA [Actinomycetota bacterium]
MSDVDKKKALEVALGQIEKQFGKGSLMKLGDDAAIPVAAIPTGALALDLALGIGGLPRGRVVEIYGPESSGKCIPAGTYVWSDHGLETIEELFARVGQPTSCTSRVTDVSDHGVRLVNEEGELEPMAAVTHNDRQPVWRVQLQSGRHVMATANHPLRLMNERGQIVWRTVEELQLGDVLVSALFGADESPGTSRLTEDEALLLGYLVAEGSLGESSRHVVEFINAHDPDVSAEYIRLLRDVFGVERDRVTIQGGTHHRVFDTRLRRRLHDEYGLDFTKSAGKTIPHRVRTGGPKIQRAFLSALYEGDGWIEKGPEVGLTTASRELAEQVQLLLYGLGIPASLNAKFNRNYERDYHTVLVSPGAVLRFLDLVGFRSKRREEQVRRYLRQPRDFTQFENVPHVADLVRDLRDAMGGDREFDRLAGDLFRRNLTSRPDGAIDCSPTRLDAIVDWAERRFVPGPALPILAQLRELLRHRYTYERIVAIEEAGEQPTFDVVVPKTHSFLANGVLSHNTSVALHVIAEAQKLGGIAAFIDAEHALDPVYARAIGVDIDEMLVSQPDTGEQALEITDMLVRSGAVDIIVVDSVAALVPRAEIEGEMGDTHVGLQARLMSQALRKLAGSIKKSNTCTVFINQLREKVGVMFGCASGSTRVSLADGSHLPIAEIVKQQLDVEVLSYDDEAGAIVPRRVTGWFDNGPTTTFLHFAVERAGGGVGHYESHLEFTPNHLIMTPEGWLEAQELQVGDQVIQAVPHHLSDQQWEVVLGTLMGDGALSPSQSGRAARLRWGHGAAQAEYADWKASLFGNINVSRSTNAKGAVFYDGQPLAELADLRDAVYFGNGKVLSHDYLKRLTPLSLALWYMDDATFTLRSKGIQGRTRGGSGRVEICVQAIEATSRVRLQEYLRDTWGIEAKLTRRGKRQMHYLVFSRDETDKLQELVAPYIHPSMDYKLLPRFRGRFEVESVFVPVRFVPTPMQILRIDERGTPRDDDHRYDIEVEGTHNYFADGVMVHNSPETTPGGRALKFYSSVRLDVRRIETLKDGTDAVGNRVRVKVVKNKVASPFKLAEFDILYGEGISREGSLLDVGVDTAIIRKAGAWYTYEGEQLGQGRENARTFLKENPDIANEIAKRVRDELGIDPIISVEEAEAVADADEE